MKSTRLKAIAMLSILAASMAPQGNFFTDTTRPVRLRKREAHKARHGTPYPEQSSRQALRGSRRAQGGPGIELVGDTYQVRGAA